MRCSSFFSEVSMQFSSQYNVFWPRETEASKRSSHKLQASNQMSVLVFGGQSGERWRAEAKCWRNTWKWALSLTEYLLTDIKLRKITQPFALCLTRSVSVQLSALFYFQFRWIMDEQSSANLDIRKKSFPFFFFALFFWLGWNKWPASMSNLDGTVLRRKWHLFVMIIYINKQCR